MITADDAEAKNMTLVVKDLKAFGGVSSRETGDDINLS